MRYPYLHMGFMHVLLCSLLVLKHILLEFFFFQNSSSYNPLEVLPFDRHQWRRTGNASLIGLYIF